MTTDARILLALRGAGASGISGEALAQELGISRAAVWARIQDLRQLGYEIQASPHGGYQLRSTPDLLHADDILSRLPTPTVVGRDITVFQETTSTNDIVEKMARDGVKEGAVVFAESQSKGRGRLGRNWLSSPGKGLWFSVLLRPQLRPTAATQITIASGNALARALRLHTQLPAKIKWPNDVLIRGRKVCGILTEMSAELDSIRHVTLGIGVNVNFLAEDFPPDLVEIATSLRRELGKVINRAELAARILQELDLEYDRILKGQFHTIAEEWEEQCDTLGRQIQIRMGQRSLEGRAEALDEDGALLLRTVHGHLERITGGDLTLAIKP